MAYFNHAFQKTILAVDGLINDTTKKLWDVNGLSVSSGVQQSKVALVGTDGTDKDTVLNSTASGYATKPFMIAGSTLRPEDKLGKFMAGFQSLNTSKKINPKYVNGLYVVLPQAATASYVEIGNGCSVTFECGTTYYLQLDVKGNAVASALMHNYHKRVPAYVTCCDVDTETSKTVLSLKIYYEWAKYIKNDPLTEGLIEPIIVTANDKYTKDGITIDGGATKTFAQLEADMTKETSPVTAGYLKVIAAFEETTYGNCTFQANDGYELQPMEIQASMVDVDGNPCYSACAPTVSVGTQKTRTGESLLRELLLDESYHQRWMPTDLRKREIEGATEILSRINRNAQYPGIYLLHSVPRFNNPSSTFDNDQYLIQIITTGKATKSGSTITYTGNLKAIKEALEAATGLTAEVYLK